MSLKDFIRSARLRLLPRRLWSRAMLILVLPVVLLQVVSSILFYDNHWQSVSRRLALGVVSGIQGAIAMYDAFPDQADRDKILDIIRVSAGLDVRFSAALDGIADMGGDSDAAALLGKMLGSESDQ